jgi:uncharacterized protein YukE
MAGELDPKKYQEITQLLKEIRRGYSDIKEANPFEGVSAREFVDSMGDADEAIIKLVDTLDSVDNKLSNVGKNSKGFFQTLIGINGELKKSNEPLNVTKKSIGSIQGIAEKLKNDQEGITRLNHKELKQLQEKYQSQVSSLKIANLQYIQDVNGNKLQGNALSQRLKSLVTQKRITQAHADSIAETESNVSVLKDIESKLTSRLEKENKIYELQTLTNSALEGAEGLLENIGLGKFASKFGDINKEAAEFTEELYDQRESAQSFNDELKEAQKSGNRLDESLKDVMGDSDIKAKVLGKTLKDSGAAFKKEMLLALDAKLLSGFKKGVKSFGEDRSALSKTFALGRDEADALYSSMNFAAKSSGEMAFNTAGAVKAMQEFNSEIGGAVRLTNEELKTFSLLTTKLGLSNQQAAEFVKTAKLRGESSEDLTASYRGQIAILQAQEGTAVNQQEIFADIGNISAANRLTMEGQGKSLAKAAYESSKLGMSQAALEKTSSSLLDFESSIAAEMEAELMTGKQLNLEDARRAALMGDQEGLAKAISREIGTSAEFGEMNVLQQQSLAKAFGMSREELAETLETQELLGGRFKSMGAATKKYNELLAEGKSEKEIELALGNDQLHNQLKAASSQERFQEAILKLKDQLIPVIEMFAKILDKLMDAVEFAQSFSGVMTSIGKIVAVIAGIRMFSRLGMAFKTLKSMLGMLGKVKSAAGGIAATLGGGGAAAGGAGAAAGGAGAASGGVGAAASKAAQGGAGAITASASSPTGFRNAAGQFAKAPAAQAAQAGGGGMFGGLMSKVKGLNPMNALKDAIKPVIGKSALGATLKSLSKRIPIIGSFIEGIFANSDIKGMIAEGESKKDINVAIGKRVNEGIGAVIGSAGGMAAIQALNIAPGLGLALTPVAAIAGDWLGRKLGGMMPGQETVGGIVRNTFYNEESEAAGVAEDFISRPGQPIQKFRADDIIMGGTKLTGDGNNTQPTNSGNDAQVITLLKELITVVKAGGDVYIDGAKAGKSLALATSRLG